MANLHRLPLLAALALSLSACGGGDDGDGPQDAGTPPRDTGVTEAPDSGVPPPDGGTETPDSGPRDCSANPFNCAPMQLMDDQCVCLEECEGGLRWNPGTGMCEEPPQGECNTAQDCPDPAEECINVPQTGPFSACNGEPSCRCLLPCDPWVDFQDSGCPATGDFGNGSVPLACTLLLQEDLPEALCLPRGEGGEQGDECSDQNPCNRSENHLCIFFEQGAPGTCLRICDPDLPTDVCEDIGPYECGRRGLLQSLPEVALCSNPPVSMDVGTTCTSSASCQGGVCSQIFESSCTQSCGPVDLCPDGSQCVNITGAPPEESSICVLSCDTADAAGDAQCQAGGNTALVCRELLQEGGTICAPRCTRNFGCQPGTSCDAATGRCN